jgi:nucleoid-associated protein YgaU
MSPARTAAGPALAAAFVSALAATATALGRAAVTEAGRLRQQRDGLAFDDLVLCCALAVLAVTLGWLCLGALLSVTTWTLRAGQGHAGRLARRMTPAVCQRLLGSLCGAAVLAGSAGVAPAAAAPPERDERRVQGCTMRFCASEAMGLPLPDRPLSTPVGGSPGATYPSVRVGPGDTLWAIAARHLPGPAENAETAAAWPRWFRTNRVRIGPDPHLIHPGTRLRVPPRFHRTDKDR